MKCGSIACMTTEDISHYKQGVPPSSWYDKRFVSIEKVRPLVNWLEDLYGGLSKVAEVTDIPYRTLQGIRLEGKNVRVKRSIALKIVEFVKLHKHGNRSFSTFELQEKPRYATQEEKALPQSFSRWRATGVKS